jgi:short subunit dehydrogenase-like uncharacterized protein
MASFNTRIVRRSNSLQEWGYGRGLRYSEVMGVGSGPLGAATAVGVTAGLAGALAAMTFAPTRALLDRVLPAPGTGPSEETRDKGWFRMVVDAATEDGRKYRATAAGPGDPGYAATAVMLGESALCLGTDVLTTPGGVVTPAVAMGDRLVERLRARGFDLSVRRVS